MERAFRSAFSIGGQSKNIDRTLDTLAADYKLTNMSNNGGESSIMDGLRRGQVDYAPQWGAMPQVKIGEGGNAVGGLLNSYGAPATNVTGMLREGGVLEAPKAMPLSSKHIDPTPISSVRPQE